MRVMWLTAGLLIAGCTQPNTDEVSGNVEVAALTNEGAKPSNREEEAVSDDSSDTSALPSDQDNAEERITEDWATQADLCGRGEVRACERANAIVKQWPIANDDVCGNGDPNWERCGSIREAQRKDLLD